MTAEARSATPSWEARSFQACATAANCEYTSHVGASASSVDQLTSKGTDSVCSSTERSNPWLQSEASLGAQSLHLCQGRGGLCSLAAPQPIDPTRIF